MGTVHACLVPMKSRKGQDPLELELDSGKLPCGC